MRCFIDMDGVVADFVGGVCRWMGVEKPTGPHDWDIVQVLGWKGTESEFWANCDYDFWLNLEKTPEADAIVKLSIDTVGKSNCCFLSTPCRTLGCETGKKNWIRNHYKGIASLFSTDGEDKKHTCKKFCAHHHSFLIDDKESNIISFTALGGNGHLIGRPWNTLHKLEGEIVPRLTRSLEMFKWRSNV